MLETRSISGWTFKEVGLTLVLVVSGLLVTHWSGGELQREMRLTKSKEPLLIPPQHLERFNFGYADLMADLLWIRAIQDFDFCGAQKAHDEFVADLNRTLSICQKGWVFQMLDAATRLAPRYRIIYTRGAVALSVIVNDREGAAELFRRGSEALPEAWPIHYAAGYHFLIEMKDYESAARFLKLAANTGAPNWVILLSAQLAQKAGLAQFGMAALKEFYKDHPFDEWPERAKERFRDLERQAKERGFDSQAPREGPVPKKVEAR